MNWREILQRRFSVAETYTQNPHNTQNSERVRILGNSGYSGDNGYTKLRPEPPFQFELDLGATPAPTPQNRMFMYRVKIAAGRGKNAPCHWLAMIAPAMSPSDAKAAARQRFKPYRVTEVRPWTARARDLP